MWNLGNPGNFPGGVNRNTGAWNPSHNVSKSFRSKSAFLTTKLLLDYYFYITCFLHRSYSYEMYRLKPQQSEQHREILKREGEGWGEGDRAGRQAHIYMYSTKMGFALLVIAQNYLNNVRSYVPINAFNAVGALRGLIARGGTAIYGPYWYVPL